MTLLSSQQKQLLFDYCMGLTSGEATAEAKSLLASNKQAAEIHSRLKSALAPLESLDPEPCPDSLVESTIQRLTMARSNQVQLHELLASEQVRGQSGSSRLWMSLGKRLATAAAFMVVGSMVIIAFNVMSGYARQKATVQACMLNQSRVFDGLTHYTSDHDGKLPTVAAAVDAPWWKVGDQGKQNHSNTRALWLLVRLRYNDASDFVCSGSPNGKPVGLDTSRLLEYHDFPSRKYISYSFRIRCRTAADCKLINHKVLMADLNPLFENLPDDYSQALRLRLTGDLLKLNSINHRRRGQCVLFEDGGAQFIRTRQIGVFGDDIYTLRDHQVYHGTEIPSCPADSFLAP